jgi:hypothetical protein
MKGSFLLLLLTILISSFLLVSCGPEDEEIDPEDVFNLTSEDADWMVSFVGGAGIDKATEQMIMVSYMGEVSDITADDVTRLTMNGVDLTLQSIIPGIYVASGVQVDPGVTLAWKFYFNNQLKGSVSLPLPYHCVGSFPATFDPAESASISWTLDHENQYQVAGANSSKYVSATEILTDEYIKSIPVTNRSFTVPANSIQDFGEGTNHSLFIDQLNYKLDNRIAFVAWNGSDHSYQKELVSDPGRLTRHGRSLLRCLNQH